MSFAQDSSFALQIAALSSLRALLYSPCSRLLLFALESILLSSKQDLLLAATSPFHQYTGLRFLPGGRFCLSIPWQASFMDSTTCVTDLSRIALNLFVTSRSKSPSPELSQIHLLVVAPEPFLLVYLITDQQVVAERFSFVYPPGVQTSSQSNGREGDI
jgi:hypothetical protein